MQFAMSTATTMSVIQSVGYATFTAFPPEGISDAMFMPVPAVREFGNKQNINLSVSVPSIICLSCNETQFINISEGISTILVVLVTSPASNKTS